MVGTVTVKWRWCLRGVLRKSDGWHWTIFLHEVLNNSLRYHSATTPYIILHGSLRTKIWCFRLYELTLFFPSVYFSYKIPSSKFYPTERHCTSSVTNVQVFVTTAIIVFVVILWRNLSNTIIFYILFLHTLSSIYYTI